MDPLKFWKLDNQKQAKIEGWSPTDWVSAPSPVARSVGANGRTNHLPKVPRADLYREHKLNYPGTRGNGILNVAKYPSNDHQEAVPFLREYGNWWRKQMGSFWSGDKAFFHTLPAPGKSPGLVDSMSRTHHMLSPAAPEAVAPPAAPPAQAFAPMMMHNGMVFPYGSGKATRSYFR